jgi:hypothetical protein
MRCSPPEVWWSMGIMIRPDGWETVTVIGWMIGLRNGGYTLWLCQNSYWKWPISSWFTELKDGDFPVRYVNLPEGTIGIYIGLILGTINQVRTGGPHLMGYFIGCVMISCWELCFLSPWCFLIGASWFGECYRMLHDLGSSENWDETTSNLMVCLWKWQKNCHVGRIRHFQAHQIAGDFLVSFDGDSNRCFKG